MEIILASKWTKFLEIFLLLYFKAIHLSKSCRCIVYQNQSHLEKPFLARPKRFKHINIYHSTLNSSCTWKITFYFQFNL